MIGSAFVQFENVVAMDAEQFGGVAAVLAYPTVPLVDVLAKGNPEAKWHSTKPGKVQS